MQVVGFELKISENIWVGSYTTKLIVVRFSRFEFFLKTKKSYTPWHLVLAKLKPTNPKERRRKRRKRVSAIFPT